MTKREILIQKIRKFDSKYFNQDQKRIAINILNIVHENDVQAYFDFICMKRKTGFAFDYSPEIAEGRLITLRENVDRRINVNDQITKDENKLIIGDNYNALKVLLITHKEKIDIIYIDPPYNTESAKTDGNHSSKDGTSSKFMYKDKFGRGGWLNMMKVRLTMAKDLLAPNGIIFVSIDDSEQAYLKVLMDDIFGEENFVSTLPRIETNQGKNDVKTIANRLDWILVYSNSAKMKGKLINTNDYKYDDNDGRGPYHLKTHIIANKSLQYAKSLDFNVKAFGKTFMPIDKNGRHCWRWNLQRIQKALDLGILVERGQYLYQKSYLYYEYKVGTNELIKRDFKTRPFSSSELINNKYSNKEGTKSLAALGLEFSMPKPPSLIKELIQLHNNNDVLVLDFFAGSGTTGQAVMELNNEDNGKRKFILCTNNENKIAYQITYERLYRVIKGHAFGNSNFKLSDKNTICKNVKLRVIDIDDSIKISLDENIDQKIYDDAKNGIKLLDGQYKKKDLQLYYDLSALNPLEHEHDKFNK